jgi:hypothetical protein
VESGAAGDVPQWRAEGDWFDVYRCDLPCPCEFAQAPTDNWCQGVLAWQGEVSKLTGIFHPANSTLTIAQATTSRVNAFGLEFSNAGKNGHSSPFSWAA